jgi:Subtilase family
VAQEIGQAEPTIAWKRNETTGKDLPNPSVRRSETGAIERIELSGSADRRQFDLDQAVVWLSSPRTGGQYEVELFEAPPPQGDWDALGNHRLMFQSFVAGLQGLGPGIRVELVENRAPKEAPYLNVRLERSALPPRIQLTAEPVTRIRSLAPFDNTRERHSHLLAFLERHPLVRRIDLPGVVVRNEHSLRSRPESAAIPAKISSRVWPKVGIVDGGVSQVALGDWIIGRWDLLADEDVDAAHGTFIGGILVAGSQLNGSQVTGDPDGDGNTAISKISATDRAFATYHGDVAGFLNEVENAIVEARTRHQVRIFNFSLNIQNAVVPNYYSKVAARLDQIADTHDVIIFISAGNLSSPRAEWPAQADMALQVVAAS